MAINLTDYSRTAAQRGWGAGWPSCGGAKAAGTAVVTATRSGTRVSVHKRIARLVLLLLDWTEDPAGGNYPLKPGQCGGYNCRAIAGTSVASNHSWGLAVDLNWNDNTFNSTGRRTLPTAVARMWNRYGFAWGGDYRGSKQDWMHLEQMGTPADVDAMTQMAIDELSAHQVSAKPVPGPAPVSPPPAPALTALEDDLMASIAITPDVGGRFHHAIGADVGAGSAVASKGYLVVGSTYGGTTFTLAALGGDARILGYWKDQRAGNNRSLAFPLPDGTRAVTAEGLVDNAGTRPWASTYLLH